MIEIGLEFLQVLVSKEEALLDLVFLILLMILIIRIMFSMLFMDLMGLIETLLYNRTKQM